MVMCFRCDRVNAYDTVRGLRELYVEDLCRCLDVTETTSAPSVVYLGPAVDV